MALQEPISTGAETGAARGSLGMRERDRDSRIRELRIWAAVCGSHEDALTSAARVARLLGAELEGGGL